MRIINGLLFTALLLAAVACSKEEPGTMVPQPDNSAEIRINSKKFYYSDMSFGVVKYIYDTRGKLLHKDWFNLENESDFKENFVYEQDKLIRIDRIIDEEKFAEVRFSYQDGQLKSMEYWLENSKGILQKSHTTQYEYQGDQIIKTTSLQSNGSPSVYSLYQYENGNITAIKSFNLATSAPVGESVFRYDDKPNPFFKVTDQYLGSPLASSRNNVVYDHTVTAGNMPQETEMHYGYTYNEKGYPTALYLIGEGSEQYLDESYTYLD